ncbi:hypothetical protein SDC9_202179 [bioreactor metagenome]|uniref:Uncharacterized protein n=1 Tax=bioreactor metagenome TaxID=1076179 RepID=A0A645IVR0_9ZZZZ
MLERGCRNAGGNHEANIQGGLGGCIKHEGQSLQTTDIHHLMGIGNDGGGSIGHHQPAHLLGCNIGGLDVNVAVDEPRGCIPPLCINLSLTFIASDPGDNPIRDGDITFADCTAIDIHNLAILDDQVGRKSAACHINKLL